MAVSLIHCDVKVNQVTGDPLEESISRISSDFFRIFLEVRDLSSLNLENTSESYSFREFYYSRDIFLCDEYCPHIILSMLAGTGSTPEYLRTSVVPRILYKAREIDNDPFNFGRNLITLKLEVIIEDDDDEGDDDDGDGNEMIEESLNGLSFKPDTSSSIQALERFKWGEEEEEVAAPLPLKKKRRLLEGSSSTKECRICLDEFSDGDQVAPMPCGHFYHDACIVHWLNASHLCPLCCFPMPS